MFCRFDPLNRLPILKIPGVIQVVGSNRQPVPVDEDEIRAIQVLVASGAPHTNLALIWKLATRFELKSGPLRGLEGLLVEFQGNRQLVLCVTLLQRSVAVKIDSASVTSLRQAPEPRETEKRANLVWNEDEWFGSNVAAVIGLVFELVLYLREIRD